MNVSPKGKKHFVHISGSSRCYNVGSRQAVADINLKTLPNNVKSDIARINHNVVKRIKSNNFVYPIGA